jgi:hypothetical protein
MTSRWARTFKTLLASTAVSALGMPGCGFLSSRGNIWERFPIALLFGWLGSTIAGAGIALVYYVKIRSELGLLVRRRAPLTDEDFNSLSPRSRTLAT